MNAGLECVCMPNVSYSQDVVMMCHEVEKALDRKLLDMPAQVSTLPIRVCYTCRSL